jgi:hypothetical protein
MHDSFRKPKIIYSLALLKAFTDSILVQFPHFRDGKTWAQWSQEIGQGYQMTLGHLEQGKV